LMSDAVRVAAGMAAGACFAVAMSIAVVRRGWVRSLPGGFVVGAASALVFCSAGAYLGLMA
jgi:hypothetical protein